MRDLANNINIRPAFVPGAAADLLQEYEAKIAALERMVGRQALEIERLKGALKHRRVRQPSRSRRTRAARR